MPLKTTTENIDSIFETLTAMTDSDKVAEKLADRGVELARETYGRRRVHVYAQKEAQGVYRVVAEGKNVAFEEFGTGIYAKGSYAAETEGEGQLPTAPITFRSAGEVHTTQGWQYYYPSEAKEMVGGRYGWFITRNVFVTGKPARAQLWKTGKRLREELRTKKLSEIVENKKNDV